MKLLPSLSLLGAFLSAAVLAPAQTAPKIAVVDLQKVFTSHYQYIAEKTRVEAAAKEAQGQFDDMQKQRQDLVQQINELKDQAQSPMATNEAKAKAQSDADAKIKQYQQLSSEVQDFYVSTQRQIAAESQRFQSALLQDIIRVIGVVAKRDGDNLVFTKDALPYSDSSFEITDEVIAEINRNRPTDLAAPPSSAAPAPASELPAPSSSQPTITVPGITQ